MSNSGEGKNACSIVCGTAGAVFALIVLVLARQSEGIFVAFLLAALIGASFWWMLSTFLCMPVEDAPAAKPAAAPEPAAVEADETAAEDAEPKVEDDPAPVVEAPVEVEAPAKAQVEPEAPAKAEAEPEADETAPQDGGAQDYDGDGVEEGAGEGTKPEALSAPRDGAADDLKKIKGVGPKLEGVLHGLGFYHFDQIASWTADEIAWVDANLEGFRGRVSRDEWVAQAKLLAAGEATAFSKKVDKGDVY